MITQDSIGCRGFSICHGTMTANENLICSNTTDGFFNNWIYLYSGSALAGSENSQTTELIAGDLVDVSQYANAPIKYVAGNNGAKWLGINPMPTTKRYNARLVKGNVTETISSSEKEIFIVCAEGTITCNSVQVKPMQYARIVNTSKTFDINGTGIICIEQ